jgi:hypothetical protein
MDMRGAGTVDIRFPDDRRLSVARMRPAPGWRARHSRRGVGVRVTFARGASRVVLVGTVSAGLPAIEICRT